jgi:hypothetical protein
MYVKRNSYQAMKGVGGLTSPARARTAASPEDLSSGRAAVRPCFRSRSLQLFSEASHLLVIDFLVGLRQFFDLFFERFAFLYHLRG